MAKPPVELWDQWLSTNFFTAFSIFEKVIIMRAHVSLNLLSQLFPERQIKTDFDATKLIEELGDGALRELQRRLKSKETKKMEWGKE